MLTRLAYALRHSIMAWSVTIVSVHAAGPTPTPSPAPPSASSSATPPPQISKVPIGESVALQQNGQTFEGLYTPASTGKPKGAALLLADLGQSNDAPEVINSLRTLLPRSGWSTLSIPLPPLEPGAIRSAYGAKFSDAAARIGAGLTFLRNKDTKTFVLVGHGMGATAGVQFLAQGPAEPMVGFVAIGIDPAQDLTPAVDFGALFEKLKVPVLDIYGVRDHTRVRQSAERRHAALRRSLPAGYTRVALADAVHGFNGLQLYLVNRIRGWMDKQLTRPQEAAPAADPSVPAKP